MKRAPASVVLLASGNPGEFRGCLESLLPTLALRDEVVCVVDPADHARTAVLTRYPRVRTVPAPPSGTADPAAARWAAGLAATTLPLVVLVDGDVIVSAHWLDTVLAAFADPAVVAAGPRCQRSAGPQDTPLPTAAASSPAAFRAFARQWRDQQPDEPREVDRLGPVCAAFRRPALAAAGGPGREHPYRALRAAGRVVVLDRALVAHLGRADCALRAPAAPSGVLLSASMIVKDEERVLGAAVDALRPFVDEVVVYDTGSTDATRDIAREHGARVVEGFWDDHFGDARNRGIAHCRGEWVFIVDADEVAGGDPLAVREAVGQARADALLCVVDNLRDGGGGAIWSVRLFRRDRGRYAGRLHEQVVDRLTGEILKGPLLPELTLTHSGYLAARVGEKDKVARNLELARAAAADPTADSRALANLAQSEMWAGAYATAIDVARDGLERARSDTDRVWVGVWLVRSLISVGQLDEAEAALADLRRWGAPPATTEPLAVRLSLARGEPERALELLAAMPAESVDHAYAQVRRDDFADLRIRALAESGQAAEAGTLLRARLRAGDLSLPLERTVAILAADGGPDLAATLPAAHLRALLTAATSAPAPVADQVLEGLWGRHPGEPVLLVLAARVSPRLAPVRALEWSARLRAYGLATTCPLIGIAAATDRSPRDRVLAAAVALATFGDERAMPLLEEALAEVPEAEHATVVGELRLVLPELAAALEPAAG